MGDYIDDREVWKRLILAVLNRALMDYAGVSTSRGGNATKGTKTWLKGDASKFINSEYCEWMCDVFGINLQIIRSNREILKSVNKIPTTTPKRAKKP